MKKIYLALLVPAVLVLVVVLLPFLHSKETMTYEVAASKWAQGKFVQVGGKKMHYLEKGEGKPVILIHGFLYHSVMWKKNIDDLAKNNKVYAVDLFGWGYSERLQANEYSFERYAKQIVGFMDALQIDRASLVGQSMGGGISVYVAAHFPERVDRLILVDPAVIPYPMTATGKVYQLPLVGEFLTALPGDGLAKNNLKTVWFYDPEKVTDAYAEEVLRPLRIKGSSAGMMYTLRHVLKPPYVEEEARTLARLNKRILLIHGREDIAVPLDRSQQLNSLWKGSQLVVFEKAGHTPHEEYPEKFNQLASEFLSK